MSQLSLPILGTGTTNRCISTTPAVDALLGDSAPVAIGVSGGKDSSAVAIAFVRHLRKIGHIGEVILIHSDLGRVEWNDSLPTCQRLARFLGVELLVVRRRAGDLMDRWQTRWKNNVRRYIDLECVKLILPWSTPKMRFCTSELKTDVICSALRKRFPGQTIISVSGIRRDESSDRAKAPICKPQPKLTSSAHRTTGIDLHPIIEWTLPDVLTFLKKEGFALHEAYTRYKSSRVSCRFCIMGNEADLEASAGVPEHAALYLEMVDLEIVSTFAFQGGKWLGDVMPALLPQQMIEGLQRAKERAKRRELIESTIPKHLLYTKGWPTCIPTRDEAELLATVRSSIGLLMGFDMRYADANSIIGRYQELMAAKQKKAV